jgi:N-acetylglutamate synthase-like GNAT family acetyltransferase
MKYNDKKGNMTLLKLERKHIKPVSLMLSRAFKDDMEEVFPDPEERKAKTPYVHELYLLLNYSISMAFITSSQLEGIVVCMHSNKRIKRHFWQIVSSRAIWPVIKIGIKALRIMQAQDHFIEQKHKELVTDKHWYLAVLAVDPQHQEKGHASKLLNEMLSNIDEEGLPCYLETGGEKNISMYQHFGFEVVDEFVVPGTKDKLTAMLRKPKTINIRYNKDNNSYH